MNRRTDKRFNALYRAALFSCTFLCSASLLASGFQIQEQNVTNLGTAYSGTAALAADASTNFYNAAGLTRIHSSEIVMSAVGINGKFDLHPTAANATSPANTPITPLVSENAGGFNLVPAIHLAHPFTENFVFGFSATSSFGLKTEYGDNSVGRYVATRSELITALLSPSFAYRFSPHWSVGVGGDAQYAKAHLDASLGTNGLAGADGYSKNTGDDWAYTWHAGILYEWTEKSRLGLSYRDRFTYNVEGTNEFLFPAGLGGTGVVVERPVQTRIVLPETAILSAFHEFENNWAVMADIHWTAWHRFKTLTLHYPTAVAPGGDTDTHENWKDTWRFAVGTHYRWCDKWIFRGGVAYDKSPTTDDTRTARIPDNDRYWLALGLGYTFTKNFHIDAGYAHLFFKDANIDDRGPFNAGTNNRVSLAHLAGKYNSHADIFGVQLRIDFV